MFYSSDFKDRVMKAFPDNEDLEARLEKGDIMVGRILDDSSPDSLSLDVILNSNSLEQLQAMARIAKERKDLYTEWLDIYRTQIIPN